MKRIILAALMAVSISSSAFAWTWNWSKTYDFVPQKLGNGTFYTLNLSYDFITRKFTYSWDREKYFRFDNKKTITNKGTGTKDFQSVDNHEFHKPIISNNYWEAGSNEYNDFTYNRLDVTGLKDAHSKGWTGKDVNIHVIEPRRGSEHSKSTSGIAKAVAPGANITLSFDADWARNLTTDHDVVNHSYGWSLPNRANPIQRARTAQYWKWSYQNSIDDAPNALHIYAAGNNGSYHTNPGAIQEFNVEGNRTTTDTISSTKWVYDANLDTSRTIFVGGSDSNGNLGMYSNSAGTRAMNDFIVANGDDPFNRYNSGTSFAAPRVAGAAALVIHKFGTNAVNTKKILLETADDLGAPGVDPVYGHGLLNVEAALSPVGKLQ